MSRDQLLDELQKMMGWKKSRKFYADRLRISEKEVDELIDKLKADKIETASEIGNDQIKFEQDLERETGVLEYRGTKQLKTKEDLVRECKIDLKDWEITRMVHNAWGTNGNQNFQTKAILAPKSKAKHFGEEFKAFLKTYNPKPAPVMYRKPGSEAHPSCLLLNIQDAHLNKYDITGNNSIQDRFDKIEISVGKILKKATTFSKLEKIYYIVGSDLFNSEWTNATTKGTPQTNLLPYQASFEAICDHEIRIINQLLEKGQKVDLIYVPGNHDEYVGWHMISWLKAYYRNEPRLTVDSSIYNRKYVQYDNTGIMFNHGDGPKPIQLASLFPVEYKQRWSECAHTYMFTGHFHREMYAEFNGTKFYGLPALSKAKGSWDDKRGYSNGGEIVGFLIAEKHGMTDIYKELL